MPREKKRGDNVASPHSSPRKAGQQAQDEFTRKMQSLVKGLEMQLTIEPNADTFNNILNKKDKKKLN